MNRGEVYFSFLNLKVKLPMLLSKPKNDYKSVNKTENGQRKDSRQEETEHTVDIHTYDEIQSESQVSFG